MMMSSENASKRTGKKYTEWKLIQEANFYEKVKSKLGMKDLKIKKNQHKKKLHRETYNPYSYKTVVK